MISKDAIFNIASQDAFNAAALVVFNFQFEHNTVYRSFCDLLHKHPSDVKTIADIPFLPIQFFKSHQILSSRDSVATRFKSSGTTGSNRSTHLVTDLSIYNTSFTKGFHHFYGAVDDYVIIALLPSYLEQNDSSLIYMVNHLIGLSKHSESGFYLEDYDILSRVIKQLEAQQKKVLLIGVSYALLDVIAHTQFDNLQHTIIMETGGMKGRRKELIRAELHDRLTSGFGVNHIHSEYGMTELLSQAYSKGHGVFECPPWMKVLTRDTEDALTLLNHSKTGGINIIDLANVNSCAFIATQDLGKTYANGSFEILGRFDNSDIRGCNLMVL